MQRLRKYLDPEEMKVAFAFLLSMPGAPFLYYGDEIGMRQLDLVSKEGGYDRTGARTPMQWGEGKNAGFLRGGGRGSLPAPGPGRRRPHGRSRPGRP